MEKLEKTNVMRLLDAAHLPYTPHRLPCTEAVSATEVAEMMNMDPLRVFKTLVTQGASGAYYVFVIPGSEELDLKKAAAAVGEKSIAMIKSKELLPLTGYIHGGCSPIGMKKAFPTCVDESAALYDTICFSAGKIGVQVEMSAEDLLKIVPYQACDLIVM